ncbi:TPA: DNA repair protein [Legionella pneumophila]|nr:DNA repair protein [Legionella pneumophila subsp. pneumophila]HBD7211965.1 DNA repair protein [Legionella pneumophila]HBZ2995595.1 DNA repair protein [Legionella pneumophila]HCC0379342.1 DNA repair protein [Legionella pneumophila]HCW6764926.1 DNA repair protein [Legionella pneumophila]
MNNMWYQNIMRNLLEKLPEASRKDGEIFLSKLFLAVKKVDNKPEMEFFLGLIEKSFLKFENEEPGSVTLVKFSRYILGLTLLYLKSSNDLAIWNSDFIPSLTEIKKCLEAEKAGKPFYKFINQLEVETFASLNHQLAIDFNHFSAILKRNSDLKTIQSFTEACKGLDNDVSQGFCQVMQDAEAHMINLQFAVDFDSGFGHESTDENQGNTKLQKPSHVNYMSMSANNLHRLGIFKLFAMSDGLSDQSNLFINQNNELR